MAVNASVVSMGTTHWLFWGPSLRHVAVRLLVWGPPVVFSVISLGTTRWLFWGPSVRPSALVCLSNFVLDDVKFLN